MKGYNVEKDSDGLGLAILAISFISLGLLIPTIYSFFIGNVYIGSALLILTGLWFVLLVSQS